VPGDHPSHNLAQIPSMLRWQRLPHPHDQGPLIADQEARERREWQNGIGVTTLCGRKCAFFPCHIGHFLRATTTLASLRRPSGACPLRSCLLGASGVVIALSRGPESLVPRRPRWPSSPGEGDYGANTIQLWQSPPGEAVTGGWLCRGPIQSALAEAPGRGRRPAARTSAGNDHQSAPQ
jgi:hypothetical protein